MLAIALVRKGKSRLSGLAMIAAMLSGTGAKATLPVEASGDCAGHDCENKNCRSMCGGLLVFWRWSLFGYCA
jgi:hypothetical protein